MENIMELTPEKKAEIDAMTYTQLLSGWRFAPVGDQRFLGETGEYWSKRMGKMREEPGGDEKHTRNSKEIGWK